MLSRAGNTRLLISASVITHARVGGPRLLVIRQCAYRCAPAFATEPESSCSADRQPKAQSAR